MIADVINILVLSTLAGVTTGVGGLIVLLRRPNERALGFLMGLASGIMILLSFLELVSEALKASGLLQTAAGFITGSLLLFLLDYLLPHEHFSVSEKGVINAKLLKSGTLLAIGVSIHNLPEGIAVASGYSLVPATGLLIAIAMAVHNIPEGMAIALPIYAGGGSKWAAFRLALASGLMEPLGALIAAIFLKSFPFSVPFGLAFAGGVMVFITLDELIPVAHEHGHEHYTSFGVIVGCIVTFMLLAALW